MFPLRLVIRLSAYCYRMTLDTLDDVRSPTDLSIRSEGRLTMRRARTVAADGGKSDKARVTSVDGGVFGARFSSGRSLPPHLRCTDRRRDFGHSAA